MSAEAARAEALPLFVIIDGAVGPVHPDLVASWDSSSAGSPCARCAAILEDELTGLECPGCMREYAVARGCKCAGTNLPSMHRARRYPGRRDGREERRRSGDVVLAVSCSGVISGRGFTVFC